MELKEAREVIAQALDAASKKGVYGLNDMALIIKALEKINSISDVEFQGNPTPVEKPLP